MSTKSKEIYGTVNSSGDELFYGLDANWKKIVALAEFTVPHTICSASSFYQQFKIDKTYIVVHDIKKEKKDQGRKQEWTN